MSSTEVFEKCAFQKGFSLARWLLQLSSSQDFNQATHQLRRQDRFSQPLIRSIHILELIPIHLSTPIQNGLMSVPVESTPVASWARVVCSVGEIKTSVKQRRQRGHSSQLPQGEFKAVQSPMRVVLNAGAQAVPSQKKHPRVNFFT